MGLTLIPFHNIDPVALQIGPIAIRWYGLAYLLGLLFAWAYTIRIIKNKNLWNKQKPPIQKNLIADLVMWCAIGVFVGGRLGYVLFYDPYYFFQFPSEIIMMHKGGMSFHGGFIGVLTAATLFARKKNISPLTLFDIISINAPIGLGLGRMANFINGELWGKPTQMPWAVIFPHVDQIPRHPTQIYEAMLEGLCLFIILQILVHKYKILRYPGAIGGVFAVSYAFMRIFVEFFREPDAHIGYWGTFITTGMILSIPMILIGVMLITYARKNINTNEQ